MANMYVSNEKHACYQTSRTEWIEKFRHVIFNVFTKQYSVLSKVAATVQHTGFFLVASGYNPTCTQRTGQTEQTRAKLEIDFWFRTKFFIVSISVRCIARLRLHLALDTLHASTIEKRSNNNNKENWRKKKERLQKNTLNVRAERVLWTYISMHETTVKLGCSLSQHKFKV